MNTKERHFNRSKHRGIFFTAIIGLAAFFGLKEGVGADLYLKLFAAPNISYELNENYELIKNTFELKSGNLVLHPQLEIRYHDKIIKILYLKGIYKENKTFYQSDTKGFSVIAGDWTRVREMKQKLEEIISEKLTDDEAKYISINEMILLDMNYQNLWRDKSNEAFFAVEDKIITRISKIEVVFRTTETDIILNGEEELDLNKIADDCILTINSIQ